VKWFCRRNRACFLVAWVVALAAGVGLIVGAAAMIAGGQKSTTGEHYWDRLRLYYANDFPDFNDTTVTNYAGFVHRARPVPWNLVGKNGTDSRHFYATALVGTVPRPTGTSRSVTAQFDLTLSQTYGGTIVTSQIRSLGYQLVPNDVTIATGQTGKLHNFCMVIEHAAHGGQWTLSEAYPSCEYPFEPVAASNYGQGVLSSDPIHVTILTRWNLEWWLLEQSQGRLTNVPDTEVLLVNPNMPTLLGLGCALLVTGAVLLPYFCCCVVPPEADEVAPWEVEAGQVAVESMPAGEVEGFAEKSKTADESASEKSKSSRLSKASRKEKSGRSGAYSEKSDAEDEENTEDE